MPRVPPVLAITAGDPCGIGPEVILKTLSSLSGPRRARLVLIGDLAVFARAAARLRRRLPSWEVRQSQDPPPPAFGPLTFLDCGHPARFTPGRASREAGAASLAYLERAIALWRRWRLQGLVTGPVTKWAIQRVKPSFVGQTEYLARAMGAREVVMMFVAGRLRVALLTRHIPLREVPGRIDRRLLRSAARAVTAALVRDFHIARPRLAVCGLNPHAGEGASASEEQAVMRPALHLLRRSGLVCDGPFAADGLFAAAGWRGYDAVLCGYHDQGLIPFKMAARDHGCQLSVGLPIVRTSPDHGSALDIAGQGIANPGSMRYALEFAITLARRRAQC